MDVELPESLAVLCEISVPPVRLFTSAVPEPGMMLLVALGGAAAVLRRRRSAS